MKDTSFLLAIALLVGCSSSEEPGTNDDKTEPLRSGIHVENGQLVDKEGNAFVPYGFNSVHVWLDKEEAEQALRQSIPRSGANTVRLVTSGRSWTWNNQSSTSAQKRFLVETAVEAGLVPMLEMHDGTCLDACDQEPADGKMGLSQIVDEWLQPENVSLAKAYEGELLINIANEWGPQDSVFLNCYKEAITRLRNAGINNVLVIDAGRCGQGASTLLEFGDALYRHDPLSNILLSIHMYGFWRTEDKTFDGWTPPYLAEEVIPQLAALEAPVVVGEFGWEGEGTAINYDPRKIMQLCKENNIGWLFWAWYDGQAKPYYNTVSTEDYSLLENDDLSESGKFIVNDPELGMRNIARKPAGFE